MRNVIEKASFNQLIASILAILCLLGVIAVYFFPSKTDASTKNLAIGALTGTLSACIIFLMKASSDAQHAEQMKNMTDALANSTPVKNS